MSAESEARRAAAAARRRQRIAKLMVAELLEQQENWVRKTRSSDPDGFAELVNIFQECTGETRTPTTRELAEAEADMVINAGDALREYMSQYEDLVTAEWESRNG